MKKLKKILLCIFILSTSFNAIAQETKSNQDFSKMYIGPGIGFDYGGFGLKFEYLPKKNFSFFAGAGYNFNSLGWNVGTSLKLPVSNKVSINPMFFYGYNATLVVRGKSYYNDTSYGVTFGANVDIKLNDANDKLSVGLFVPLRSKKFMDHYEYVKNLPYFSMNSKLMPIGISIGYNIAIRNTKKQ